jgi:hypothetical protein
MRGLMVAQTWSVSLNFSSGGLYKIYSFTDGPDGFVQPHFIHLPFIVSLLTPLFLASRRAIFFHFQSGFMDKPLFVSNQK